MRSIKSLPLVILLLLMAEGTWAAADLRREPADGELRLGQRVRVDDGTCPAGQIKEITAAKMTERGLARTRICVKK